jgi:hypothetical protein
MVGCGLDERGLDSDAMDSDAVSRLSLAVAVVASDRSTRRMNLHRKSIEPVVRGTKAVTSSARAARSPTRHREDPASSSSW